MKPHYTLMLSKLHRYIQQVNHSLFGSWVFRTVLSVIFLRGTDLLLRVPPSVAFPRSLNTERSFFFFFTQIQVQYKYKTEVLPFRRCNVHGSFQARFVLRSYYAFRTTCVHFTTFYDRTTMFYRFTIVLRVIAQSYKDRFKHVL